jgi:hypothetical protein
MNNRYHKYTPHETVFDVNALAIDEKTVCITGIDPSIIKQLTNRGINCSLHCLTLDLDRESV